MAKLQKIDSNVTGLRYQEETSIGVANSANPWVVLEPNSYDSFGGEISTVARNPINASRQRRKGVVTDLDSEAGFETDLLYSLGDLLQGFVFADYRRKVELAITAATVTTNIYSMASTAGLKVGDIINVTGFANLANNGPKRITVIDPNVSVTVDATLVSETESATAVVVGFQMGAGELEVVTPVGDYPRLSRASGTVDFEDFGLIPGEWIFIGGDVAAQNFATAANFGFARVKAVTETTITLDKTQSTFVADNGATKTIRLGFGRVLKNENLPENIIRRTYQLERLLGAPESTAPSEIQAEYVVGAVPGEVSFTFSTADKALVSMSFVGIDMETVDGPTSLKAGDRPNAVAADAYNTSSDFSRLTMKILTPGSSNPSALFAYVTEFSLSINNNLSPNKAISVLGAFDVTAGQFEVEGSATAYFADVAAVQAVRDNADVTFDYILVNGSTDSKKGIAVDVPLVTLGDTRPNVTADEPITLPLTKMAASGVDYDENMDHTILFVFFDYLPNAADMG